MDASLIKTGSPFDAVSVSYEFKYLNNLLKTKNFKILYKFRYCARYLDDLLLINNDKFLDNHKHDIYPRELDLISAIKMISKFTIWIWIS